jgi:hemolysin activation/secretion protein
VGDWQRSTRWRARGAFLRRRIDRAASEWWGTFAIESARRAVDVRTVEGEPAPTRPAEERQTLVNLRLAGERWVSGTLSVAATGLYREVSGDTDDIPLSEQYRLGGARSLRGYLEDQFHGERVASAMLELRIGRPGRSRLYTFFDVGYFRYSGPDPVDSELSATYTGTRRGFGLGIETSTPGGDVTLAIGLPGTVQFDDAKLHIALLQVF